MKRVRAAGSGDLNKRTYNLAHTVGVYDTDELKWTEAYIFDHYFLRTGRVLDLGCGTGRTSEHLARRGHCVIGIDYSEAMVRRARKKFPGRPMWFLIMDAKDLSFRDATFDYCVFSFNGLDCLYPQSDRTKALREIYRVLKPGGTFAFSSHNSLFIPNSPGRMLQFARTAVRLRISPYRLMSPGHGPVILRYISPAQEVRELERVGFTGVRIISKYSTRIRRESGQNLSLWILRSACSMRSRSGINDGSLKVGTL